MAMVLEKVVPFGRSLDEYVHMFNLTPADLTGNILAVADGPASFNAEGTQLGYQITSIDPIYQFTKAEIQARFNAVVNDIIQQIKTTPNDWVWSYHRSPEDLRAKRVKAIQTFLADYDQGKKQGRYLTAELPELPFTTNQFDLALCSHFLFLYSEHFDAKFHLRSLQSMLRAATEVRIFPLLTLMRERSPHLEFVIQSLIDQDYAVSVQRVGYELQRGGNEMLVVHPKSHC
ncbi:SAM-dependent methyltransferase [Pantanalinema sp. GBBB05]|uniref:SAM-dependent methyltransferase n=1 Tax=Pantanalinema sp. GBBB05 TaxID=2604139 RepID=UPI001DF8DCAE|nr:SAM-dependent methyltransferase [Pantanalinema sp. GBBB05]